MRAWQPRRGKVRKDTQVGSGPKLGWSGYDGV